MKCPKCRRDMQRKEVTKGNYYYECTNCHNTIGKPKEGENERKEE